MPQRPSGSEPATYHQRQRIWKLAVEARRLAPRGHLTSDQAERTIAEFLDVIERHPVKYRSGKPRSRRGCRGSGRGKAA